MTHCHLLPYVLPSPPALPGAAATLPPHPHPLGPSAPSVPPLPPSLEAALSGSSAISGSGGWPQEPLPAPPPPALNRRGEPTKEPYILAGG